MRHPVRVISLRLWTFYKRNDVHIKELQKVIGKQV